MTNASTDRAERLRGAALGALALRVRLWSWVLAAAALLINPKSTPACSYTHELVCPLRTVVNKASDVIVCRFHAISGPVLEEGKDYVYRRADSVVVGVEHVLKGELRPGLVAIAVSEGNMCSAAPLDYYQDAQLIAQSGYPPHWLLALEPPEAGVLWRPASSGPRQWLRQ